MTAAKACGGCSNMLVGVESRRMRSAAVGMLRRISPRRDQTADYVSTILGQQGSASLLSQLKAKVGVRSECIQKRAAYVLLR
jgi:hypothetical protein